MKCCCFFFLIFELLEMANALTASSETLLWKKLNKTFKGIKLAEEAFILVPADYEDSDSPLIPVNVRKFTRDNDTRIEGEAVNVWFIPGGPGQSSKTLEVMLPVFLLDLPAGSSVYAIDHRGLGKSTPLATTKEKKLLEAFPKDLSLLPQVVMNQQSKLGILTPITRALRIENVARDLLKGVELVKKENDLRKHFLVGVSYGTMVARRALQIAPIDTFAGVLLDGLAPTEKIEQSNESDRILQEFCEKVNGCAELLRKVEGNPKIRGIIPSILRVNFNQRNSCTNYFMTTFITSSTSLCFNLHEFMNAVWLNGRASVKVGGLRIMFEMINCEDPESFKNLFDAVHEALIRAQSVNQLQAAVIAATSVNTRDKQSDNNALTSDELVFEVVSALERYDVTRSSMNICFNKKHSEHGNDSLTCPSRRFDPCKFFKTTWERRRALEGINGPLPPVSIKTPLVVAPNTRIVVVAGNLDFNTPTWLSRQITAKYTKGLEVNYHELFGYGHGIYGPADCNREIFAELLNGGKRLKERTENCVRRWNKENLKLISGYFKKSFNELAAIIRT